MSKVLIIDRSGEFRSAGILNDNGFSTCCCNSQIPAGLKGIDAIIVETSSCSECAGCIDDANAKKYQLPIVVIARNCKASLVMHHPGVSGYIISGNDTEEMGHQIIKMLNSLIRSRIYRRRLSFVPLTVSVLICIAMWSYVARQEATHKAYVAEQVKTERRAKVYKDLLIHSNVAVLAMDHSGQLIEWSESAERLLGWKDKDVIGKRCEFLAPPNILERTLKNANGASSCIFSCDAIHSDGSRTPVQVCAYVVQNGSRYLVATIMPVVQQ